MKMPASPPKKSDDFLYGIHPVTEAITAGRREVFEMYIARDTNKERIKRAIGMAREKGIPVKEISPQHLKKLCGANTHQGVGAKTSPYPTVDLQQIIQSAQQQHTPPFLLLIDSVLDPHNLGALIRTAAASGIHGIIIPKDRSAKPTPAVSKTSAGSLEHVLLATVTNLVTAIQTLKKQNIWALYLSQT